MKRFVHGAAVFSLLLLVSAASSDDARVTSTVSTNFASSYLGAKIVEHSPEAKGVHHLLKEDASYMLIPCGVERKRFTVQLAREVSVRTVALTNLEYFSSIVEHFVLLGSLEYPCVKPCQWYVLGRFTANFTREQQFFTVASAEEMGPAVRYLRFLWISHNGQEKSCTLTTIQVFGHDRLELVSKLPVDSGESDYDTDESSNNNTSLTFTTLVGPQLPEAPWRDPASTPLNVSHRCMAHPAVRDVEMFLERRSASATCHWNVTRPQMHPVWVLSEQQVLGMQRQLALLRRNVTTLVNQVAGCGSAQAVDALTKENAELSSKVVLAHVAIEELRAELAMHRLGLLVALGLTVAIVIVGCSAQLAVQSPFKPRAEILMTTGSVRREAESSDTEPTALITASDFEASTTPRLADS